MENALSLPRTDALTKPFFVSALRTRVEELRRESSPEPEPADSALAGLRFLAAEDNEVNAEILAELLTMEGAACELTADGRQAVERFRRAAPGEFDVMNGHEAARAIRALDRPDAGQIPIIAMTANAFAEDEKAALDAGMDAHVPKPLDMELLKKALRQCREGKDGQEQA